MENPPVVVGYDGSPGARAALRWAVRDAAHRRACVRLVYALEPSLRSVTVPFLPGDIQPADQAARAAAVLDEALGVAARSGPTVAVTTETAHGEASLVLRELASGAAMIVVGGLGRGGLAEVLIGSVSAAVAAHADGTVVVVRPDVPAAPSDRPVVAGFDGSPAAGRAVAFAGEEAALRGVGLTIVHPGAARDIDPGAWAGRFPHLAVTVRVPPGSAARAVTTESDASQLVVIGARGDRLGPVARYLLHHAIVPVAIVHG
jgi:nucleotide-binding universal stress UspA family protein